MDDIVRAAMAKWPSVPDCWGWLALEELWWNDKGRFQFCEPLERHVRVHKPDMFGRITDIRNPSEKIVLAQMVKTANAADT